ncbi:MAG: glycosyltransferase [Nitrospirota bacterium]
MDDKKEIVIHHCISSLYESTGGPVVSVVRLCESLSQAGICTTIHTLSLRGYEVANVLPSQNNVKVNFTEGVLVKWLNVYAPFKFKADLYRNIRGATLLHSHGLWLEVNHIASRVAKKVNIPLIVSPRGMLEEWSLNHKRLKKKIAWHLYQKQDLLNAAAFCATSSQEAESIRSLGFKQPIAVIPNGVVLPPVNKLKATEKKYRIALFLSRLSPKKGIIDLINAWNHLTLNNFPKMASWRLNIVGPDEGGYKKEILKVISNYQLQNCISVLDPAYGNDKQSLFDEADLFILPSYSENFGNVIIEALASAVPVITTKGTPWKELVDFRCGWWTDVGFDGCVNALREALSVSDTTRAEMGIRGRKLVEDKYSWRSVTERMIGFYKWLIERKKMPDFVRAH